MSDEGNLTPTKDRNDPWSQNFEEFKNHHQSDRNKIPKSSVFDVQKIQNLIQATGATKIAFYAMKHPNPVDPSKEQGLMVAVGFTDQFERIDDVPYLPAVHNCPTECFTDPFDRIKVRPKAKKLRPTPDPFEQDYEKFKRHVLTDSNKIPRVCIFDKATLEELLGLNGTTKIAFYPMKHPHDNTYGLMVAVPIRDNGSRIPTVPYRVALHNCPDDCITDPFDRPRDDPKPYDPKPDDPKPE